MDINEFVRTYFRLYYNGRKNKCIMIETRYNKIYKLIDFEIIEDINVIKVWLNDIENPNLRFFNLRDIISLYEVFNLE